MIDISKYNKECLKMAIPLYGLYKAFRNDIEQKISDEEAAKWGAYHLFIDSIVLNSLVYSISSISKGL